MIGAITIGGAYRLPGHAYALVAGITVLIVAWAGPLPALSARLFSAHMALHIVLVAIAAPLLALGLRPYVRGRAARVIAAPILAAVLEFVVMWGWHLPAPHAAARAGGLALVAEQGSFLLAGMLVWSAAFAGGRDGLAAGAGGLLLTSMHLTLLGALLTLSPRPLYAECGGLFGLSPLEDQAPGCTIMLAVGTPAYLIGGVALIGCLLTTRGENAR